METQQSLKSTDKVEIVATELRWQSLCLSVVAASTIGIMLYLLRPVLVPFVVAVFFTVGLSPILEILQRRLLPSRVAAVTAAFLLGVILLLLLFGTVTSSIDQLANDDAYQRRAVAVTEWIAPIAERLGLLPDVSDSSATSSTSVALSASTHRRPVLSIR